MKFSSLSIMAVAAALIHPTKAMNPEDIKGVISDSIVPTPDLCQSLCSENSACFYSLYHLECNECWQMDCSAGNIAWTSATGYTKLTTETIYYCNSTLTPDMPDNGCKNLTATATITSLSQATETGSKETDSAALGRTIGWIWSGTIVGTAMVLIV
ncbi:hypothetical protein EDB81DRAFT_207826 [Dactylonectria macrodidyma]|uniref:Uncharacterized protein n=1 Tax=Dactylonectria macrodidyma TaxID=307937 RepID=A0A9P9IME3_9HYPO|nr:hypothetical protein EDB81DRAFT_207826 [Dactylonectria macrodidyma]